MSSFDRVVTSRSSSSSTDGMNGWSTLVGYWYVTAHGVTIQQIYSQRIGQTFAVEASRRQARIQAGRQARRDEPSDCVG